MSQPIIRRLDGLKPPNITEKSEEILRSLGLKPKKFIVINSGAGWYSRRWPLERYSEIASKLFAEFGIRSLLLWGGKQEEEWANTIREQALDATIMPPSTSLMEMSGFIKRACLYLGSDTGPMHMSAAVQTPCVAMFGTTRAEYSGPYGNIHHRLQKRFDGGSSKHRRHTDNAAMCEITTDEVLDACRSVLATTPSSN